MKPKYSEFILGAKDTFPMLVGATPFAIIFGSFALSAGLSEWGTMGFSLFVFAGSSQFIAATLVAQKANLGIIWLTTLVVNFRHILYSATLLPHLRHLNQVWKIILSFGLTDESFATSVKRLSNASKEDHPEWYLLGSTVSMYVNWNVWTIVGIYMGKSFPNLQNYGLEFAMIATFTGIVVPLIQTRPMLLALLGAGVSSILFRTLPYKSGLLVSCFVGVILGVLSEKNLENKNSKFRSDKESAL